jgi:hypothetical protein
VGSWNGSWQRVYLVNQDASLKRVLLRVEGYSTPQALPGGPDVVWEASFYRNNTLAICVGGTNSLAGAAGPLSGVTGAGGRWLASFELRLNSLYVLGSLASYTAR